MDVSSEALVKILPYYTLIWKTEFCDPSAKETVTNQRLGEGYLDGWRLVHMTHRDRDDQVCLAREAEGKTQAAVPS